MESYQQAVERGFNPFWFRSSLIRSGGMSLSRLGSFNPFWFRSSLIHARYILYDRFLAFQSLLVQVLFNSTYAAFYAVDSFNPFWFRSSLIPGGRTNSRLRSFQSLLVQVLFNSLRPRYYSWAFPVSIPSGSGPL